MISNSVCGGETTGTWDALAQRVLDGDPINRDEALSVLRADDSQLLDILAAAYRVRRRYFGNTVQLYFLMNAKSGLCPEDCGYCSQSKISTAQVPKYTILNREKLLDAAR
ncbi:MAG: biotin synthase BioB, partial [Pirellulaceae bacterium]